jgi:hypothetical protein
VQSLPSIVGYEYSMRVRMYRLIAQSRVSRIYLHGIELEKGNSKYWLCKHCHDVGKSKVLLDISTGSCSKHLNTHDIYPPGIRPPSAGVVERRC